MIAGLICNNAEIFSNKGVNHATIGGHCITYPEFPLPLIQAIDNSITPIHHKALDEMGIYGLHARRNQWLTCNLANLDFTADYDPNKTTFTIEVVACDKRNGGCNQEGKLCTTTAQAYGFTNRQIEVLTLIGKKLLDKEIAHQLGISTNTVPVYTKQLREKTGLHRKADLALYAKQLNLI